MYKYNNAKYRDKDEKDSATWSCWHAANVSDEQSIYGIYYNKDKIHSLSSGISHHAVTVCVYVLYVYIPLVQG